MHDVFRLMSVLKILRVSLRTSGKLQRYMYSEYFYKGYDLCNADTRGNRGGTDPIPGPAHAIRNACITAYQLPLIPTAFLRVA